MTAIAATTVWYVSAVVTAEPNSPKTLDDIFAPVVVGTPPVNAFNGLFRCPDGEIRHYGDDGFLFSRDDGLTWAKTTLPPGPAFVVKPPHQGPRWENWCVEPTVLELEDGRLWMLARTSRDTHHECFSEAAGKTWSSWRPSRFYGTLTMPTLYRLSDGRVLLLWCNTTPLPEIDRSDEPIPETARNGRWEDVFTNRDACHVAISEDDGRTWIGFREMRLNPLRNAEDFGSRASHDFSIHQPQALELPDGKILVAHGQDEEVRALVIFDPIYRSRPDETPRLLRGQRVQPSAWHSVSDPQILARLAPPAQRNVCQADLKPLGISRLTPLGDRFKSLAGTPELFFNGEPMQLARWPNDGWVTIERVVDRGSTSGEPAQGGTFVYREDRQSSWAVDRGVWLHGYWCHDWSDECLRVATVDSEKREITLAAPHG